MQYGTASKATEIPHTANVESAPSQPSKPVRQYWGVTLGYGAACSLHLTVRSRVFGRRRILGMLVCVLSLPGAWDQEQRDRMFNRFKADGVIVGAGFLTGGSLAIRGGFKAARNSAIGCAILLAVIEGVGIGIQRMMAENTRLDVRISRLAFSFFQGIRADRRNSYQLLHRLPVQRWIRRVR